MTLSLFLLYFPLQLSPGDAWPQSNEGGSREPGPKNDLRAPATYIRKTVVRPNGDLGAGGKRNAFKGNTRRNSHQHGGNAGVWGINGGREFYLKWMRENGEIAAAPPYPPPFRKRRPRSAGGTFSKKKRGDSMFGNDLFKQPH